MSCPMLENTEPKSDQYIILCLISYNSYMLNFFIKKRKKEKKKDVIVKLNNNNKRCRNLSYIKVKFDICPYIKYD